MSYSTITYSRAFQGKQRKVQFHLDVVAPENSMGFHAPQESARILGEAIDYARQGQMAAATAKELPVRGGCF